MVRLFDIQNGKVVPSEHCYTLSSLKRIMDEYGEEAVKVYSYLFYMTCPNPDLNPFFDIFNQVFFSIHIIIYTILFLLFFF